MFLGVNSGYLGGLRMQEEERGEDEGKGCLGDGSNKKIKNIRNGDGR